MAVLNVHSAPEEPGRALNLGFLSCAVSSQKAPYKQTPADNQDSWLAMQIDPRRAVLAVADGAGGYANGSEASQIVISALQQHLTEFSNGAASLREPILNALEHSNREMQARNLNAASTAVIAEVFQEQGHHWLRSYHVGDSTLVVTGQRGAIKLQTVCHSPIGFGIEAGLLDDNAALTHKERHWVSNLVGLTDMRIEIGSAIRLSPLDRIILCSDGLTDNLAMAEIVEYCRKGPLEAAVELVGDQCIAAMHSVNGHEDDLTLILTRLSPC